MDKVVQNNAASAEESASSSQEMIVQAEKMKGMVAELVALVEGRLETGATRGASRFAARFVTREGTASSRKAVAATKKSPTPEQMIPLDEDEAFSDF